MGLDRSLIGEEWAGGTLLVTRDRLRLFAKATGQTDPVFVDLDAAKQAGNRDLPVPPTFFFCVDLERPDPFDHLVRLGVDLRTVLHGEQEFTYHRQTYAGDELRSSSTVVDVFEKRGGALTFLVTELPITDQDGTVVVTMRNTLVVRALPEVSS